MNSRLVAAQILLAAAAALPGVSSATNVTINDTCGSSLAGSITGAGNLAVDPAGNLTVNGFGSAPFSIGVGQCATAAPTDKPKCTLIATPSAIEPGGTVTFVARCITASAITGYTWSGPTTPALPANSGSVGSFSVTFPGPGAFGYTVSASNANGAGIASAPATVLVGASTGATIGPACAVTLSPNAIIQNQSSNIKVSCQPDAVSGYSWDAPDTGAPAAAGAGGTLTFNAPGYFTYKVRGVNAAGPGPKASATVTVVSDGSCVPGPYIAEVPLPLGYSPDAAVFPGNTVAWSFTVTGAYAYFTFQYHSAYNYYWFPNAGQVAVSKCRGDFNVPAACQGFVGQYWSQMFPAAGGPYASGSSCNLDPGVTYYLNIKPTACDGSPSGQCGYRVYRYN